MDPCFVGNYLRDTPELTQKSVYYGMPMKNQPRKRKQKPRTKVAFKGDGTPNQKVRKPFHDYDPEHHKLYNRKIWATLSQQVLQEDGACVICRQLGKISATEEIDHVIPHKGDFDLFTDIDNLWGLCKPCHAIKTGMESNGAAYKTKESWARVLVDYIRRQ